MGRFVALSCPLFWLGDIGLMLSFYPRYSSIAAFRGFHVHCNYMECARDYVGSAVMMSPRKICFLVDDLDCVSEGFEWMWHECGHNV